MVTIYTKPGCGACIFTKNYLQKQDVAYREINLNTNEEALIYIQKLGFHSLPVIEGPGVRPFSGYQPDLLADIVANQ